MRLRYAPVRAIVAPVAAASDDGAVAKARVTVVLAPVADEAHPLLIFDNIENGSLKEHLN
ncbi:hypothetical protein S83_032048, partial [Arachis hypogaea]